MSIMKKYSFVLWDDLPGILCKTDVGEGLGARVVLPLLTLYSDSVSIVDSSSEFNAGFLKRLAVSPDFLTEWTVRRDEWKYECLQDAMRSHTHKVLLFRDLSGKSDQQLPVNTEESSSQTEDTNSTNHPLFLHLNDHLGLILISKKLLGLENYSLWRRSMTIALNAKNKLKIITKDYPEHDSESPLRALWERNNDMIISWIFNIPLPNATKAYGMLRLEEKQRETFTPRQMAPTVEFFKGWKPLSPLQLAVEEVMLE
ncbi:cysteine-rich receptor-like protein kinase 8 [Tanacetum coccineum]